ncbi:CCA tRNA nucleotidyltransferase [Neptunicoccus cionae]|uniref:CCA tRNA nucleotidyltransferase n=1 Tax=Neptunicoccus cionae TaxID=2035344 RepID=UPI000C76A941|nr:CCA tRNA nucleotidyltransferase [Amylibacter cionae]PLS22867.1 CCA tRNA nucleotidyltransferase [Amylibacter cionae]
MIITADWLRDSTSQALLGALTEQGFEAYFVGGCVRNALLDAPVSDLDVATSARPEDVQNIMENKGFRTVPTGIEHGTITVLIQKNSFEVTSFRKDVETFGRRAVVAFSSDITDDARRRDFTMNALYAGADGRVVDPLNGLPDLIARRLRFIEDADRRIKEDYLRILRYFRFFAWYGDQSSGLDPEALAAISDNLDGLDKLSKERIGAEIRKLLKAETPEMAFAAMEQTGVLQRILPGATTRSFAPLVHLEHQLGLPADWLRRLLVLGGEGLKAALRLSNAEATRVRQYHQANVQLLSPNVAAYRFGEDTGLDLALVQSASLGLPVDPAVLAQIKQGAAARFPVAAKDLQGFEGKALGDKLRELESAWIESGFTSSKADLLSGLS